MEAAGLGWHLLDDLAARLLARAYLALGQLALLRVYRLGGGVAFLVLEHELRRAGGGDGPRRGAYEGEAGGEEAVVGVLYGLIKVPVVGRMRTSFRVASMPSASTESPTPSSCSVRGWEAGESRMQ